MGFINNIFILIFSLFFIFFGIFTYFTALYSDNIRKVFNESSVVHLSELNKYANNTDAIILVKGNIIDKESFTGKKGGEVIFERYKEELQVSGMSKRWKNIKDKSYFKVIKVPQTSQILKKEFKNGKLFVEIG